MRDVIFTKNPMTKFFEYDGNLISVAEYFHKTYNLQVTEPQQPLFMCKMGGHEAFLPTEFCSLEGVPN